MLGGARHEVRMRNRFVGFARRLRALQPMGVACPDPWPPDRGRCCILTPACAPNPGACTLRFEIIVEIRPRLSSEIIDEKHAGGAWFPACRWSCSRPGTAS